MDVAVIQDYSSSPVLLECEFRPHKILVICQATFLDDENDIEHAREHGHLHLLEVIVFLCSLVVMIVDFQDHPVNNFQFHQVLYVLLLLLAILTHF